MPTQSCLISLVTVGVLLCGSFLSSCVLLPVLGFLACDLPTPPCAQHSAGSCYQCCCCPLSKVSLVVTYLQLPVSLSLANVFGGIYLDFPR
jgi:hypothetical protein